MSAIWITALLVAAIIFYLDGTHRLIEAALGQNVKLARGTLPVTAVVALLGPFGTGWCLFKSYIEARAASDRGRRFRARKKIVGVLLVLVGYSLFALVGRVMH